MLPNSRSFAAPWDRQLRISTGFVCLLMLILAIVIPAPVPALWLIKPALLIMPLITWLWAPRGYRIDADVLVIRRAAGDLRMSLAGLREARRIPRDELRGALRTFGVGGSFGYYGSFMTGIESQKWYVTDLNRCVHLDLGGRMVVVSPSDPEAFLQALPVSANSGTRR